MTRPTLTSTEMIANASLTNTIGKEDGVSSERSVYALLAKRVV